MLLILKKTVIKERIEIFGGGFNPLTYDAANLLALYNGDTLLADAPRWLDQSVNGYFLSLFNNPVIISPAINGHDAMLFDGINQYARSGAFVRNQPVTIYIVAKQIGWNFNAYLIDGLAVNTELIRQNGASPNISSYSGNFLDTNPDLVLNNYNIITAVFNGVNSELRTNNNIAVFGDNGAINANGVSLASQGGLPGSHCNYENAFTILRSVADNTPTQNLFINWLKTRFAL